MRAILRGIAGENASALRGLTGQGEPGFWTLLGGSNAAPDSGGRRLGGGPRQGFKNAVERLVSGSSSTGDGRPGLGRESGVIAIRNPRDPSRER